MLLRLAVISCPYNIRELFSGNFERGRRGANNMGGGGVNFLKMLEVGKCISGNLFWLS